MAGKPIGKYSFSDPRYWALLASLAIGLAAVGGILVLAVQSDRMLLFMSGFYAVFAATRLYWYTLSPVRSSEAKQSLLDASVAGAGAVATGVSYLVFDHDGMALYSSLVSAMAISATILGRLLSISLYQKRAEAESFKGIPADEMAEFDASVTRTRRPVAG